MKTTIIAVVDDDPRVLKSLDNLLQSVGYVVHCFRSPNALLQDVVFAQADCLITDVEMPGMSGFELQDIAASVRPELPVILITATGQARGSPGLCRNNRGFFQKPFDVDELLKAIATASKELRGS